MPKVNPSLGEWIDQNIRQGLKPQTDFRLNTTLVLSDPDGEKSPAITIEDVPENVSVAVPQKAREWDLFDPGPYGWRQRCDFILMGETTDHYFAILIELKGNVPDEKGDIQLQWSLPLFHCLLSSYCIDNHSSIWKKNTKVKYFQIGTDLYDQHKDLTRLDESNFFKKDTEDKIEILYSKSNLFSLELLLKATAQP